MPGALCIDENRFLDVGGDSTAAHLLSRSSDGSWTWRQLRDMTTPHTIPGMCLLPGGRRAIVAGGRTEVAEVLDLPTDDTDPGTWTRIKPLDFLINFSHMIILDERMLFFSKTSV